MPKTLSPADIEAFRNRLCDIAEDRFAAHGPHGVTMRELADAMGVSSMTPYRYFEDKDAILAAVRTRAFNRFAEAMETAAARTGPPPKKGKGKGAKVDPNDVAPGVAQSANPDANPDANQDASQDASQDGAGNTYMDFALSNRAAYRLMFDVDQPTAEKYPELVAAMERARATMGMALRELASAGKFKGDVEQTAHILWSAMHGPVMLELAGLLSPPLDARAIARPMLRMLLEKIGLVEV